MINQIFNQYKRKGCNFVSSFKLSGGYIGLFVGYTVSQIPACLKILKKDVVDRFTSFMLHLKQTSSTHDELII